MNNGELKNSVQIKKISGYSQCTILWRNLPALFKDRWRSEAEKFSTNGYKLFIKTNMSNLSKGSEIKLSPWH